MCCGNPWLASAKASKLSLGTSSCPSRASDSEKAVTASSRLSGRRIVGSATREMPRPPEALASRAGVCCSPNPINRMGQPANPWCRTRSAGMASSSIDWSSSMSSTSVLFCHKPFSVDSRSRPAKAGVCRPTSLATATEVPKTPPPTLATRSSTCAILATSRSASIARPIVLNRLGGSPNSSGEIINVETVLPSTVCPCTRFANSSASLVLPDPGTPMVSCRPLDSPLAHNIRRSSWHLRSSA